MWWNQDAFTQMPSGRKSERDRLWDAFYLHFDFKPGMNSSPAIREPTPSLTFDLSPIFSAEGAAFTNAETRVNDEVLAARQSAFGDRRLAVLDWQHPAYWFQPEGFQPADSRTGPSPSSPKGEYHMTITVRNCPFDKFRAQNTPQVCALNVALAQSYLDGLDLSDRVSVELRPSPDSCCVAFDTAR